MLFGGNLIRQPAFVELKKEGQITFRHIGDLSLGLDNERYVIFRDISRTDTEMIEKEVRVINDFCNER